MKHLLLSDSNARCMDPSKIVSEALFNFEEKQLQKQLTRAFRLACSSSTSYREKIAAKGIDQSVIVDPNIFRKLPIISREELVNFVQQNIGHYIDIQNEEFISEKTHGITRLFESDYSELVNIYYRLFATAGVRRNDLVLISDYGTSPLSYLASKLFCSFERDGLAEKMGFVPLSVDGIPEFTRRTIHVILTAKPRIMFIRHDLVAPLLSNIRSQNISSHELNLAKIVVTANCNSAENELILAKKLNTKVVRLLRDDLAFYAMIECEFTEGFHILADSYLPEIACSEGETTLSNRQKGKLVITALFPTSVPVVRFETSYEGYFDDSRCSCPIAKLMKKSNRKIFFMNN